MGAFLVEGNVLDISDDINKWIQAKGLTVKNSLGLDDQPLQTKAVQRRFLWGINVVWKLHKRAQDRCFVQIEVKPTKKVIFFSIVDWILVSIFGTVFFQVLWTLKFPPSSGDNVPKMVVAYLITALTVFLAFRLETALRRKLSNFENSFWESIANNYRTAIVAGVLPQVSPSWLIFVRDLLFAVLIIYGLSPIGYIPLFFFIIFLAMVRIPWYASVLLRDNPYEQWKTILVSLIERWSNLFMSIFFFLLLMALINQLVFVLYKSDKIFHKDVEIRNLVQITLTGDQYNKEYPDLDSGSNLEKRNLWMTRVGVDKVFKSYLAGDALLIAFFLLLLIAVSLLVYSSIKLFMRAAIEWQGALSTQKVSDITGFPFVEQLYQTKTLRISKVVILVHYLIASFVNLAGLIFSIEGVSYCFFKQSLIFGQSEVLFSWLFTISMDVLGNTKGVLFSRIVIVCLSFPAILLIAASFNRLRRLAAGRLAPCNKPVFDKFVEEKMGIILSFIKKVCGNLGLTEPDLVITQERYMETFVKGKLFGKKARIFVSLETIKRLNENELKAVVAHELGHLKAGLNKIEWLRALSVVTLFSNYYLTLVLDTNTYEREADLISIEQTGDNKALINALIKTSIFNLEVLPVGMIGTVIGKFGDFGWKRTASFLKRFALSMEFFFGEGLLGYSHPPLDIRIAYLRGMDK